MYGEIHDRTCHALEKKHEDKGMHDLQQKNKLVVRKNPSVVNHYL
jgi:hypothetical protein